MNCPNCGAAIKEGSQFCTECGTKIVSEPAVPEAPVMPAEVPDQKVQVCTRCGAQLKDGEMFCTNCGAPLGTSAPVQAAQPMPQPVAEQPANEPVQDAVYTEKPSFAEPLSSVKPAFAAAPANLKEFVLNCSDPRTKSTLKTASIWLYVLAGLNFVFTMFVDGGIPLDAIFLAALGFWHSRSYSPACAIALLVYAVLTVGGTFLLTGSISGFAILLVAVMLFTASRTAQKQYAEYQATGKLPQQ